MNHNQRTKRIHSLIFKTLFVVFGTIVLILVPVIDNSLGQHFPSLSPLVFPFLVSVILVLFFSELFKRLSESNILKYEFISIITHKFRTPLTYLKWSVEALEQAKNDAEKSISLEHIKSVNTRLVELTGMLIELIQSESRGYLYTYETVDLVDLAKQVIAHKETHLVEKKIAMTLEEKGQPKVHADLKRVTFVLQLLVENAIMYTPVGGTIVITVDVRDGYGFISVKDSGLGIPPHEMSRLFSEFYRGEEAKKVDTEGMGIGLFMAKNIVHRNKGKIWAQSEGLNKGSTFSFIIPISH